MTIRFFFLLIVLGGTVYAQEKNFVDAPTPVSTQDLRELEKQVVSATKITKKAIVSIIPEKKPRTGHFEGGASGVIISADGLVLSQAHVTHTHSDVNEETGLIENREWGDVVEVVLHDGRRISGKLLHANYDQDISLLQLPPGQTYPFLRLSTTKPQLGHWVLKWGHPLGYREDRGPVVRLGRVHRVDHATLVPDCVTAGGDSGGPLVDLNHRISGLIYKGALTFAAYVPDTMTYWTASELEPRIAELKSSSTPPGVSAFERVTAIGNEANDFLSKDAGTHDRMLRNAWKEVAKASKGGVVELLYKGKRTAFGTVVGRNLVISKASRLGKQPKCRLPSGEIVEAELITTDATFDLAFVKVQSDELRPVTWSESDPDTYGRFLMTPSHTGEVVDWGVVSVVVNQRNADPPKKVQPAPLDRESTGYEVSFRGDDFPVAFEHDTRLELTDCGGPILNLNGNVVGVTIAKHAFFSCIAIPASTLRSHPILNGKPPGER